jgi:hypothetical protein
MDDYRDMWAAAFGLTPADGKRAVSLSVAQGWLWPPQDNPVMGEQAHTVAVARAEAMAT